MMLLASVGVLDSGYLLFARLSNTDVVCVFAHGCDTVAKSPYSILLGIPLSLLGLIFYVIILMLLIIQHKNFFPAWKEYIQPTLLFVTTLGFLSSVYFTYLQGWVIGAWCTYCIISAITSTALFLMAVVKNK